MNLRRSGGPAALVAGPRFVPALRTGLAMLVAILSLSPLGALAADWIPPRPVTAWLAGATIAPGQSVPLELLIRADAAATSLEWTALASGGFTAAVTPSSGALVAAAGVVHRVPLTVTLPAGALGLGSISVKISYANGGGSVASVDASLIAATNGRPEIWAATPTWTASAGASGAVSFRIRSQIGTSESVILTGGRTNPDANNDGATFVAGPVPASVVLPAGGTVAVDVPVTLAENAWAGNANTIQLTVTSNEGLSTATSHAVIDAEHPDSVPTDLRPTGLVPLVLPPAGRDGPVALPGRNAWLIPDGTEGIRVWRASSTDSIGLTDVNADGGDDRLVGTVRVPGEAVALSVVPGFVTASGETLDVGLLAAGRAGLMLLDLRVIEDPTFGAWEDFFDSNVDGVDDRIFRVIPMQGFATDVAWTRSSAGRVVAFVAAADSGSNPVSPSFDPAAVVPGTGAGIVALDVTAAIDSLPLYPVVAGTWATPGNALDAEVRGEGSAVTLAVADGASGLAVADVTIGSGAPATVSFAPRAATPLASTWGVPHARDAAWLAGTASGPYLAVAAAAAGLQIVRVPASGAPTVVVVQQTAGSPCGVASAWSGLVAAAQNAGGTVLLQSPGAAALDLVAPGAAAPYTAPVALARGAAWPGGVPLEQASFTSPAGGATALAFEPNTGSPPGLLVSDRTRVLLLRPGVLTVTGAGVESPRASPRARRVRLDVTPNPSGGVCVVRARAVMDAAAAAAPDLPGDLRIEIIDVRGRVVRVLAETGATRIGVGEVRRFWDGRDRLGRRVASGRYWARARSHESLFGGVVSMVIVR